jgi:hypothetical protein
MSNLYKEPYKYASYQVSVDNFIWPSGFRGDFLEIIQSETRIICGIFIKELPRMLPTKFQSIWPSGFRGADFLEINQSEIRIVCGGHGC